jgi:hypothetical protein
MSEADELGENFDTAVEPLDFTACVKSHVICPCCGTWVETHRVFMWEMPWEKSQRMRRERKRKV